MVSSLVHRSFSKSSPVNLWNLRIREAANQSRSKEAIGIFRRMKQCSIHPNNLTFPFLVKACSMIGNLKYSQLVHAHALKSPYAADKFVQTTMVDMYVKCGRLDFASKLFDEIRDRDVAAWNAILVGFAQSGSLERVSSLFSEMRHGEILPDSVTIIGITQGVGAGNELRSLKGVHSFGLRLGLDTDASVANTWIAVYAKCGDLISAEMVFNGIDEAARTVVSWNSLIAARGCSHDYFNAFGVYRRMLSTGVQPNAGTLLSLLSSHVLPEALLQARLVHCHGIQLGCVLDITVSNAFISMYCKCGDVNSAKKLFDGMFARSCVSWTAVISGYAGVGNMSEALTLFHSMKEAGEKPDFVTLLSLISGCGRVGALEFGKKIDGYASSEGLRDNLMVCNALIDMYSKCGSMGDAWEVFKGLRERTVVSWTSMISGCSLNGQFQDALTLFNQMTELNLKPNNVTFLATLQACSHAGFLDEGRKIFNMMETVYNICPGLDHFSCMVDLLGRSRKLKETLELIQNMPMKPDAAIWASLLGACKIHRNVVIGQYAAENLLKLEPQEAAPYVEMANIYASAGRWDGVARIRSLMKANNVRKSPGKSLVHFDEKVNEFTVGDTGHPESEHLYESLNYLTLQSMDYGIPPLLYEEILEMELV